MAIPLEKIRSTKKSRTLGIIRMTIGVIMFSTGMMKLPVPMLWNAWSVVCSFCRKNQKQNISVEITQGRLR